MEPVKAFAVGAAVGVAVVATVGTIAVLKLRSVDSKDMTNRRILLAKQLEAINGTSKL